MAVPSAAPISAWSASRGAQSDGWAWLPGRRGAPATPAAIRPRPWTQRCSVQAGNNSYQQYPARGPSGRLLCSRHRPGEPARTAPATAAMTAPALTRDPLNENLWPMAEGELVMPGVPQAVPMPASTALAGLAQRPEQAETAARHPEIHKEARPGERGQRDRGTGQDPPCAPAMRVQLWMPPPEAHSPTLLPEARFCRCDAALRRRHAAIVLQTSRPGWPCTQPRGNRRTAPGERTAAPLAPDLPRGIGGEAAAGDRATGSNKHHRLHRGSQKPGNPAVETAGADPDGSSRTYLPYIHGRDPGRSSGPRSEAPNRRHPLDRKKNCGGRAREGPASARHPHGSLAGTAGRDTRLMRCKSTTAAPTQIRLHCRQLSHPILGDAPYAPLPASCQISLTGQSPALRCAWGSTNPISGRAAGVRGPLPPIFEKAGWRRAAPRLINQPNDCCAPAIRRKLGPRCLALEQIGPAMAVSTAKPNYGQAAVE